MQAVILAAGEGTRIRPLTTSKPKPMLPVGGRPLLEHVLETVAPYVDEIILVVGYEKQRITDHFGDIFEGVPIQYVTQDDQQGTADAVEKAESLINNRFLVLNGDIILTENLIENLLSSETAGMAVREVDNPASYGVIDVMDGEVTQITEKPDNPPTNLANLGVYCLPPEIFEYLSKTESSIRGEREITDSIQQYVDAGGVVSPVEFEGPWLDVGRPWELLDANSKVLSSLEQRIEGEVEEPVTFEGQVIVEEGARVRTGAYISGPVIIQAGADIGPNCYIRGATSIGENVRVGNAVEIKNSILMDGTNVGHQSYVGDSVLGEDVNFGAGTNVANLRHDGGSISMNIKGESVDTGRRKLGVVVGDSVKTGIDTSLNAGIKLDEEITTMPGEVVLKDKQN